MQSKSTKKSLIASGLALLTCCALLAGTTFAWFTDSVVNKNNKIQAGKLDITLSELKTDGNYVEVGEDPIFDYSLWEPGYSDTAVLRVTNAGSLALKWNLRLTVNGDAGILGDVIDVYAKVSEGTAITTIPSSLYAAIQDGYTNVGTLNQLIADPDGAAHGVLYSATNKPAGGYSEAYAGIVLHMRESAGNAYQGESIGSTFDIVLNATQYTYEKDGFDNENYDSEASYPVRVSVSDTDSIENALNNPGVPVDITLTDSIGYADDLTVTGDVTMNLGENRLNQSGINIVGADIAVENGGSLIINAVNAPGSAYTAGKLSADGEGSTLTVNGGKYGDSGRGNANVAARNGSVIYLNEGSFSTSGFQGHAVTAESGATVYIAGGSYSTSGADSSTIYANGGTIVITALDSIHANGRNYDVDNGGTIILSKAVSSSRPTSVGADCTITDDGENWVITKA